MLLRSGFCLSALLLSLLVLEIGAMIRRACSGVRVCVLVFVLGIAFCIFARRVASSV